MQHKLLSIGLASLTLAACGGNGWSPSGIPPALFHVVLKGLVQRQADGLPTPAVPVELATRRLPTSPLVIHDTVFSDMNGAFLQRIESGSGNLTTVVITAVPPLEMELATVTVERQPIWWQIFQPPDTVDIVLSLPELVPGGGEQ